MLSNGWSSSSHPTIWNWTDYIDPMISTSTARCCLPDWQSMDRDADIITATLLSLWPNRYFVAQVSHSVRHMSLICLHFCLHPLWLFLCCLALLHSVYLLSFVIFRYSTLQLAIGQGIVPCQWHNHCSFSRLCCWAHYVTSMYSRPDLEW